MIRIGSDFHDRSPVGYHRSKIDHNRLRILSSQQHLLAISAAKEVIFPTFSGTIFGKKNFFIYFDHNRCQILGSINQN